MTKKELSKYMSKLGKKARKLHPISAEKYREMANKRWAKRSLSTGVDNDPIASR